MSKEKETVADIVAEMRDEGHTEAQMPYESEEKPMEASNAKAMREALNEIQLVCYKAGITIGYDVACGIIKSKSRAALSAPPRNCDRPECATTKEAQDTWRKEDGGKSAYHEWLLATSAKGGAE